MDSMQFEVTLEATGEPRRFVKATVTVRAGSSEQATSFVINHCRTGPLAKTLWAGTREVPDPPRHTMGGCWCGDGDHTLGEVRRLNGLGPHSSSVPLAAIGAVEVEAERCTGRPDCRCGHGYHQEDPPLKRGV